MRSPFNFMLAPCLLATSAAILPARAAETTTLPLSARVKHARKGVRLNDLTSRAFYSASREMPRVEPLHASHQIRLRRLDDGMVVVVHQGIGMHPDPGPPRHLAQGPQTFTGPQRPTRWVPAGSHAPRHDTRPRGTRCAGCGAWGEGSRTGRNRKNYHLTPAWNSGNSSKPPSGGLVPCRAHLRACSA